MEVPAPKNSWYLPIWAAVRRPLFLATGLQWKLLFWRGSAGFRQRHPTTAGRSRQRTEYRPRRIRPLATKLSALADKLAHVGKRSVVFLSKPRHRERPARALRQVMPLNGCQSAGRWRSGKVRHTRITQRSRAECPQGWREVDEIYAIRPQIAIEAQLRFLGLGQQDVPRSRIDGSGVRRLFRPRRIRFRGSFRAHWITRRTLIAMHHRLPFHLCDFVLAHGP